MELPLIHYEDETVRLYHGDALELLPEILRELEPDPIDPRILLVTDPPYGIAHKSSHSCDTTTAPWLGREIEGDGDTTARDAVLRMLPESWAVFGSPKLPPPEGARAVLVWDKGPASGMGDLNFPWKASFEFVFIRGTGWAGRRDEGVLRFPIVSRASMGRLHPNEKPVGLMAHLISKHGAPLVIDPFAGAGSTLVAAKRLRRRAVGIEIDRYYCEQTALRLR